MAVALWLLPADGWLLAAKPLPAHSGGLWCVLWVPMLGRCWPAIALAQPQIGSARWCPGSNGPGRGWCPSSPRAVAVCFRSNENWIKQLKRDLESIKTEVLGHGDGDWVAGRGVLERPYTHWCTWARKLKMVVLPLNLSAFLAVHREKKCGEAATRRPRGGGRALSLFATPPSPPPPGF